MTEDELTAAYRNSSVTAEAPETVLAEALMAASWYDRSAVDSEDEDWTANDLAFAILAAMPDYTIVRRADADREVERLREALLSRIVDIRWAGTRDPSDYWRGFNDALDKCETEIEAALLTQQPKP